jgi:DNA-binding NarL/FixJ family response regulator
MKVIIVRDANGALPGLESMLRLYPTSVQDSVCLNSIDETLHYLQQHSHPEIILLNVRLRELYHPSVFNSVHYTGAVLFAA